MLLSCLSNCQVNGWLCNDDTSMIDPALDAAPSLHLQLHSTQVFGPSNFLSSLIGPLNEKQNVGEQMRNPLVPSFHSLATRKLRLADEKDFFVFNFKKR